MVCGYLRRYFPDERQSRAIEAGSNGSLEVCTIEHVTRYDGFAVITDGSGVVYRDHCVLHQNDYGLCVRNGTKNVSARFFYWGTVTQSAIENRIRHRSASADPGRVCRWAPGG